MPGLKTRPTWPGRPDFRPDLQVRRHGPADRLPKVRSYMDSIAAPPPAVKRVGRWVFLLTLALYTATTGGSMATDIMTYEVTKGIVEQGTVAMSYNVFQMDAHRGVDGRYYAPYGIGHAVYSVPFYMLGRAAENWTRVIVAKSEALRKAGFVVGSAVAAALTVWIAFFFAWRLSSSATAAAKTALALGFGTLLWPYAKFGFSAPLATLSVLVGTYGTWVGTRSDRPLMLALGGLGLGSALLIKHELGLLCLPVGLWIVADSAYDWRVIVRRGLLVGLPVVAAILVTLYYNYTRFGNPLDTGYLRDETVAIGSVWTGLAGLLFSPGRSVFLYSPVTVAGLVALVALSRRDLSTMVLFSAQLMILLFFYATLAHWDAERSYGPRYLLPAIPFLVLALARWFVTNSHGLKRRLLTGLVVVSVLIQLPGVLVDFSKVGFTPKVGDRTWEQRRWTWEASGVRLNSLASVTAIPENLAYLVGADMPPPVKPPQGEARDFSEQFAFSLDFWWVYLFYLRAISAPVAIALGAGCLSAAGLFGWLLRREICRV